MRRRWLVILEVLLLVGIVAWVAWVMIDPRGRPAGAIDIKVALPGAHDRAYLYQDQGGNYLYQIHPHSGPPVVLSPQAFAQRVYQDQQSRGLLEVLLNVSSPIGMLWVGVGLLGQVLFTGRMVIQWLASERHRRSVVPPVFWWMSLVGASMLLVYFLWRKDPVGVLGQATGWFIYIRNLMLIYLPEKPSLAALRSGGGAGDSQ
ncbi:MAG: lipid-A-disaccharide synthase N-terminal domain-containing protein [Phycisphaeraceae bacterium]